MKCEKCGDCCKALAIEIDTPETEKDFWDIKWYLFHKKVSIYIDKEGTWNVEFNSKCKFLKNNKCIIYKKRPPVCKIYLERECNLNKNPIIKFENLEQYEKYLKENFISKNKKLS